MVKFGKRMIALALVLAVLAPWLGVRAFAAESYRRISGGNRFETAFSAADEMKNALGIDRFPAVIIASGTNFADALSGSYLANVKSAPILLSYNDTYNDMAKDYIRENLAENGTVYILGGTAAVPESMETGLEDYTVKRLAGENRFETNLLILQEAGVTRGQEIMVCTGTNFADSLSASAVGMPILLVWNESGKLTDSQIDFVESLFGVTYCVIGGEDAVSSGLMTAIDYYGQTDSHRLAGENRFETSVLVAERYFDDPSQAVLAYAWNYPDGLCGGPLAYAMGCPLILTMNCYEEQAYAYAAEHGITGGIVLGGGKLICDQGAAAVFQSGGAPGHDYQESGSSSVCAKCGDKFWVQPYENALEAGEQVTLTAYYSGTGTLSWTSSDASVAAVEGSGKRAVVTARKAGSAVITASNGTVSASAVVTVSSPVNEEPELILNVSRKSVIEGDSYQTDCIYTGSGTLTWTSSDPDVATVDSNGTVTAVGVGACYIVVTDGTLEQQYRFIVRDSSYVFATSVDLLVHDGPLYDGVTRYAGDYVWAVFRTDAAATNRGITTSSSDPSVVSVSISSDTSGYSNAFAYLFKFKSAGTAVITVKSADGEVSLSYTIHVKGKYAFDPGEGLLSPEKFADYATRVACENGMTKKTTLTSWRLFTLTPEELTFAQAVTVGQDFVHEYWIGYPGARYCLIEYVGQDEQGNYQFHECWG